MKGWRSVEDYRSKEIRKDLDNRDKEELIEILSDNLASLRAKIGISQEEVARIMGVTRQRYWAIESKGKKMTWGNFMALLLLYSYNNSTRKMICDIGAFPESLQAYLNLNKRK